MYKIQMMLGAFSLLFIISCNTTQTYVADADVAYFRTNDNEAMDDSIESFISPYRAEMSEEMDVIIGELPSDIVKARPNSNLGNWFCDILHDVAETLSNSKIDIAIQNYGGLRVPSIQAGPLTRGEIFELMPFDNQLVIIEIDGATLQLLLNSISEDGCWPISRGLNYRLEENKAVDIKVKGQDFSPQATYRLALPDYIANSSDESRFLKDFPQENLGVFIRGAVIQHLEQLKANGTAITIDDSKRIF